MKNSLRKRESLISLGVVLVGMVCLYGITVNMRRLEAADYIVPSEEVEIQETKETNFIIDIDSIYSKITAGSREKRVADIVDELAAGSFLENIAVKDKGSSTVITLSYAAGEHEPSLTRVKKDQMVLINASIIMSLFPDIDAVKFEVTRGNEYYERVVYRPDLNDYFGIKLEEINSLRAFERIAGEFIDAEQVSAYWNMKHPYDSYLGESVEQFFKYEFPAQWGEEYPYIDEDLEADIVQTYGYRLFIEGLRFDHPLMNYYSAYRLIEYYGNSNIDEMILELASSSKKSDDSRVKEACEFAINILTAQPSAEEIEVFTRYSETDLKGGQKLYALTEDGLIQLAAWQGDGLGAFKVIDKSPDRASVLCEVMTEGKRYLFNIPLDKDSYYNVNEEGVFREGVPVEEELVSSLQKLIEKDVLESAEADTEAALSFDKMEYKWLYGDVLSIQLNETLHYIKKGHTLMTKNAFDKEFNTAFLLEGLEAAGKVNIKQAELQEEGQVLITYIIFEGQEIISYEYESELSKNRALIKWRNEQEGHDALNIMSKGKIFITYESENSGFQEILNPIMN